MNNTKKDLINPKDIVANIYDSIELIIDIVGINEDYIKKILDNELLEVLPPNIYRRIKTGLYEEELNDYQKRNTIEMSIVSKSRLLQTESVYRFYAKNEKEQITISTMFISIKLDYKFAHHILKDKINQISKIFKFLMQDEYLQIERITLNKKNSIICSSLYRLYQCFNKNLFGDIAYNLSRNNKNVEEYSLRSETLFQYEEYISQISRIVHRGSYDEKISYQGILQINMHFEKFKFEDNAEKSIKKIISIFEQLNSRCYKIFIEHMTLAFINDLVNGKTDKVIEGFHKNE